MPFTKGNRLWDNPKTKATQFKKGERKSISTEFKKGYIPWVKGRTGHLSGDKHYKWKHDRSQIKKHEKKHLDVQYKIWVKSIKDRDKWKCCIDNLDCKGRLEAHHILNWVDYPELRYEANNGITLCHFHHPRKRDEEKRLSPFFQEIVMSQIKNY